MLFLDWAVKLINVSLKLVPETASWLTDDEKAFIQARLPPNAPRAVEEHFNWREIVSALKDIRLWLFTFIWAFFTVGTSGVTFYQSTVIANLGFTLVNPRSVTVISIKCNTMLTCVTGASLRPNF